MNSTLNKSNSQKLSSSSYLNDSKYNSTLLEKSKEQKTIYHLKIILLGDVSVGKTAIINRYIDGKFDNNYSCTINVQTKTKEISLNQEISAEMTIWDTCGEEKFRALTRQYYRDTNGILLIFDLNNSKTFLNLKTWLKDIKEVAPKNVIIILIGNKLDIRRNINKEDIEKFIDDNFLIYYEISAKNGINVDLAFEKLAREVVEKMREENENRLKEFGESSLDDYNNIENIQLNRRNNISNKKFKCCKK